MQGKLDYTKEQPDLYLPKTEPKLIRVPSMFFIFVDGKGNPNDTDGEYAHAVQLLYALTFTIKMSKMGVNVPENYFEYTVPPLEGLWVQEGIKGFESAHKDKFIWTSMIRQPEFVTSQVFEWACHEVSRKKPGLDAGKALFGSFEEGLCVQAMHIGPYDTEPQTLAKMERFMEDNGLQCDIGSFLPDGGMRRHHEIYLGDPRKCKPEKLRTVLRHPVRRKEE